MTGSETIVRVRRRRLLRASAVVFWLIMMMWLVRTEAFPEFFTHSLAGYAGLFSGDVLVMDSWMRILYKGSPIGYSHTTLEVDDTSATRHHVVNNRVQAKLKMMGEAQSIRLDTVVTLDLMNQLQNFTFNLSSPGYSLNVKADRLKEGTFGVLTHTGSSRQFQKIEIPPDVVLYSPMTEMAMKNLKPGQELTLRTLDPLTLGTVTMSIRALRRETVRAAGREYEATAIAVEYQNVSFLSWIDRDGQMIRQETPFGWTLERCTIDEAFAALDASDRAEDMLTGMAVPSRGRLANPRGARELKLRLRGVRFAREDLESNRQIVEESRDDEIVLRLLAATIPPASKRQEAAWLAGGQAPESFREHLAATPSVQSDHPDVVARARAITGDRQDPLEKATRIYEYVYRNVEKKMTISLPSALDVLKTMKGDCNEHTYLFVGLARAAGLPAQIKVGLAYHQGAFYYHAWPAVYVGDWIEMDPTWGQAMVDATHLALVAGELASQVKLVKVMGQLRIEVMEEEGLRARAGPQE